MQIFVIQLRNGDEVAFEGRLLGSADSETVHDERRSTITSYTLYETSDGRFVLLLDQRMVVRSLDRFLRFNSLEDLRDYLGREAEEGLVGRLTSSSSGPPPEE
jgi:hypothetical protein